MPSHLVVPARPGFPLFTALAIIPTLASAWLILHSDAVAPFTWLRSDPSYMYLVASTVVAQPGFAPLVFHPAITVQIVSAVALRAIHLVIGEGEFTSDVLGRPELYLIVVHQILSLILAMCAWAAGIGALRAGASLLESLLLESGLVASAAGITGSLSLGPEILLQAFAVLVAGRSLVHVVNRSDDAGHFARTAGILTGLGVATKFTFLGVAIVPWILLPDTPRRLRYARTALLTFGLAMCLAGPHIRLTWLFLVRVASQADLYRGEFAPVPWGDRPARLLWLLQRTEPVFLAALALGIVALALSHRVVRTVGVGDRRPRRALLAVVVASLVQLTLLLRDPLTATRYAVPVLAFSGLLVALAGRVAIGRGQTVKTIVVAAVMLWAGCSHAKAIAARSARQRERAVEVREFVKELTHLEGRCNLVGFRGIPLPSFWLSVGPGPFEPLLREIYPDARQYSRQREVVHFGKPAALPRPGECVRYVGLARWLDPMLGGETVLESARLDYVVRAPQLNSEKVGSAVEPPGRVQRPPFE